MLKITVLTVYDHYRTKTKDVETLTLKEHNSDIVPTNKGTEQVPNTTRDISTPNQNEQQSVTTTPQVSEENGKSSRPVDFVEERGQQKDSEQETIDKIGIDPEIIHSGQQLEPQSDNGSVTCAEVHSLVKQTTGTTDNNLEAHPQNTDTTPAAKQPPNTNPLSTDTVIMYTCTSFGHQVEDNVQQNLRTAVNEFTPALEVGESTGPGVSEHQQHPNCDKAKTVTNGQSKKEKTEPDSEHPSAAEGFETEGSELLRDKQPPPVDQNNINDVHTMCAACEIPLKIIATDEVVKLENEQQEERNEHNPCECNDAALNNSMMSMADSTTVYNNKAEATENSAEKSGCPQEHKAASLHFDEAVIREEPQSIQQDTACSSTHTSSAKVSIIDQLKRSKVNRILKKKAKQPPPPTADSDSIPVQSERTHEVGADSSQTEQVVTKFTPFEPTLRRVIDKPKKRQKPTQLTVKKQESAQTPTQLMVKKQESISKSQAPKHNRPVDFRTRSDNTQHNIIQTNCAKRKFNTQHITQTNFAKRTFNSRVSQRNNRPRPPRPLLPHPKNNHSVDTTHQKKISSRMMKRITKSSAKQATKEELRRLYRHRMPPPKVDTQCVYQPLLFPHRSSSYELLPSWKKTEQTSEQSEFQNTFCIA